MSRVFLNDDYAVCEGGALKFYYGYEETVPVAPKEDEESEWAFVAWIEGVECLRIPASEFKATNWEVEECLLEGIAKYFDWDAGIYSPQLSKGEQL